MTSALSRQLPVSDEPVLVIDIGGTNIKFGYSLAGQPLAFRKLCSTDALRASDPVQALARMVEAVVGESGVRPQAIVAAVPGFIDTGVGAAFMDGGKPFRGAGWALEIGLMPFCGQGRVPEGVRADCLEAYASGRALRGIAGRYEVAIDGIFRAAASNPPL